MISVEGIFVPVPNQPLYVWPIRTSAFYSRGYVRGNGKFGSLGMHGHIIYGVQSILLVHSSTRFRFPDPIFIHGYPLYSWYGYGRTPYGGTRFRIPFIVWIWNYMVSNINIIASVGEVDNYVNIYATGSAHTGSLNLSHIFISGIESQRDGYLAYTTDRTVQSSHLFTSLVEKMIQEKQVLLNFRLQNFLVQQFGYLTTSVANNQLSSIARLYSNVGAGLSQRTMAMIVHPNESDIATTLKASVNVTSSNLSESINMSVNLVSQLYKSIKMSMNLAVADYEKAIKIHADLVHGLIMKVAKMSMRLAESKLNRTINISAHPVPSIIKRQIKLSVHPVPSEITPVVAFIDTNLVSHLHSDVMKIRGYLGASSQDTIHVKSTIQELKDRVLSIQSRLGRHVQAGVRSRFAMQVLKKSDQQVKLNARLQHTAQRATIFTSRQKEVQEFKIGFRLLYQNMLQKIEFEVLPLLAERKITFYPSYAPLVEQIGMMMTICHTHVLSYLNFVPDELQRDVDFILSVCSYHTAELLQWYLTGGRVTNEGGNEIIFDIDEVDPVGPIPSVPSRQWEGGYVEDPFKGISYKPDSGSTGFGSPSAEQWISNAQMWWKNASDPWVDSD